MGVGAHRKSTELNINPGCQDRMALATEDKEGHCLFLRVFWGGRVFNFTYSDSYTVLLKQFLAIKESGMGGEKKKGREGVGPVMKC